MVLDAAFEIFRSRVEAGRGPKYDDPAAIASLADGSVYTAVEAKENGLVDGIGYLEDAVTKAEQLAGLAAGSATVVLLGEPATLFDSLPGVSHPSPLATDLDADRLRSLITELGSVRPMYLMH